MFFYLQIPYAMNFSQNTGKTIDQAFAEYHAANPRMYELFDRYAKQLILAGANKISFKLIGNRIRWEVYVNTEERTLFNMDGDLKRFKLNDAYISRYARLWAESNPKYGHLVEFRDLRAK